jgi:glyoxalase family protein
LGLSPEKIVKGLHHITLVGGSYPVNHRFYTGLLGLRQVKLSVNQDDIFHRHAFYANPEKPTGSAITFFEWPHLPTGHPGPGSPHHLAYEVKSLDVLARWSSFLKKNGVKVGGPYIAGGIVSIYFKDPDNSLIELTASSEDTSRQYVLELFTGTASPRHSDADMRLIRLHHVSPVVSDADLAARFAEKFLGLERVEIAPNPFNPGTPMVFAGGRDGAYLRYMVSPATGLGFVGRGSIHHVALAVESDEDQRGVMRWLEKASVHHSGIVDRFWFKSLYFRDFQGNLMEIATVGPGYDVDEPREGLGSRLALPPWLEGERQVIEERLAEQDRDYEAVWPPSFSEPPQNPETL